jgi:hypothetical protein
MVAMELSFIQTMIAAAKFDKNQKLYVQFELLMMGGKTA